MSQVRRWSLRIALVGAAALNFWVIPAAPPAEPPAGAAPDTEEQLAQPQRDLAARDASEQVDLVDALP